MNSFILNKKNILFVIIFFLLSCNNVPPKGKLIKNKFNHFEKWESIETGLEYKAYLFIKNNSYYFYFNACMAKGFSKGTCLKKNNNYILNSNTIDACFYISKFRDEWVSPETIKPIMTSSDGCTPNNNIEYVIFENDTLSLINDTLFYKCKKNIPFSANIFINFTH